MPHEKDTLYVPCQHICELVRNAGFEGIAYPSAMGPGHNVVLFAPEAATPVEIIYKRVEGVSFEGQDITEHEILFEDLPW
jgi:hypothetical protein